VITVTFKELSERSGIRYETVRNYVKVLIEEGLIDEVNEEVVEIVKKMPDYTSQGLTVVEAAHRAVSGEQKESRTSTETLKLKERIACLEEENKLLKAELDKERAATKQLEEKIQSLQGGHTSSSGIAVYREEAKTAAEALKTAIKSAGSGFVQFLQWLFGAEAEKVDEKSEK